MKSLLTSLSRRWARRRIARVPDASPRDTLAGLLEQARDTRFGREFGFADILAAADPYARYRQQVPIIDYPAWVDWLGADSPLEGAAPLTNVAWPGRIDIYCLSSGTTSGRTKYIPYSNEMAAVNRSAAMDFFAHLLAAEPALMPPRSRSLYMTGSTRLKRNPAGALCGDMSALSKFLVPRLLEWVTLPPRSISDLDPWSRRLEALVTLCLGHANIGSISGIPIWQLTLLEAIAERSGKLPGELLPHLKFLIHGGMSIAPYRERIAALLPGVRFAEVYAASELGIGAYQVPGETGMRFCLNYQVFYEFETPTGDIVGAEAIELGLIYGLIVSSCSGLWRYRIGDLLVFRSRQPLMLDYVTRDKTTSAFDEKITEKELERAMATMSPCFADFALGPDIEARRHVWFLIGERPTAEDWLERLDGFLRRHNEDYDDYRGDGRINAPVMLALPDRARFLQALGREEGGQRKFPRLLTPAEVAAMLKSFG